MNVAWQIVKKSLLIISENLSDALRLTGGLFILTIFASSAINVMFTGGLLPPSVDLTGIDISAGDPIQLPEGLIQSSILNGALFFFAFSWLTVSWHRYILQGEIPQSLLPVWNAKRVLSYMWRSVVVVLCVLLIAMGVSLVASLVLAIIGLGMLSTIITLLAFYYFLLRFGLALPACALDSTMPLPQSFAQTKPLETHLIGVACIQVFLMTAISLISSLAAPNNVIGVLIFAGFQWIGILISASILTTLYGHVVEGRALK
ncbi:hypothetical protein GCM10007939_12080 [Amylibacter marinus]|uniref:Beta-carotene 15,15'-monooxygenase n=1 Tax=Amylibacter marinus TaxID=1475483 RepID=A0ABQ5VU07_9RHOB|nr:hypothetical protein [Amylibacter marinus]GLQ34925.1 hypothetical protein GCM10007939_12080 [Amylibacter marinus]